MMSQWQEVPLKLLLPNSDTVTDRAECVQYHGRLRDICNGTAYLPISKINQYRRMWGLDELPDDGRNIDLPRLGGLTIPQPSGRSCKSCGGTQRATVARAKAGLPGTELIAAYKQKGMPSCQACLDLAARMDEWGVAGCRERLDEIVADILPRARAWFDGKASWMPRLFGDIVEFAAIKPQLRADVTAAIDAAEKAAQAIAAPKPCSGCGSKKKAPVPRAVLLTTDAQNATLNDSAPPPISALIFREKACANCPHCTDGVCRIENRPLRPTVLDTGKLMRRSEKCPAGKWSRQTAGYRPLVSPTRNMIFHIYPLRGAEWNWHWHCDQIRRVAPLFNGTISIGIVTGPELAKPELVQARLADVPVKNWVIKPNTKKLAETETFLDLLQTVKTDDPNTITFRGHTKGVTHKQDGAEQPWARLMWATCMDLPSVDDALASHILAGSMKCQEPLVQRERGNWFYAGTFFWFRSDVFQRDWSSFEPTRWWPEYWPGQVADNHEAACLCHDYTKGSVLNNPYWHQEVASDFELWKSARPHRRLDLE